MSLVEGISSRYATNPYVASAQGQKKDQKNDAAFKQQQQQQYNEVYNHELAHQQAGGSYAGAIVVEKNSDGVVTGGHVNIQMPSVNKANPQSTIDHANTVFGAAMAPMSPSSQDYKVAAKAMEIRFKADQLLQQKRDSKGVSSPIKA